jgi:hypothetical protein
VQDDPTTVIDNWPEDVRVTEAEIEVFEAWFGDLFDELFSTRQGFGIPSFVPKWRALRESNPCFRRERAAS